MTHKDKNSDGVLGDAVSALRHEEPAANDVEAAGKRIWSQLQSAAAQTVPQVEQIHGCADIRKLLSAFTAGQLPSTRALLVRDHLSECATCRAAAEAVDDKVKPWKAPVSVSSRGWNVQRFAFAAALLIVAGLSTWFVATRYFGAPKGMRATVQSVNGRIYLISALGERPLTTGAEIAQNDVIRTGDNSHAFVRLLDGSVVEMNDRAEFSVSASRKDTTVHLDQGKIIVQAAKRRTGHLYVITPDCRVSVTGTVFSVNAGLKGSRVAVIEGEVRVAHAGVEDVLHPGDQTSTSPSLTPVAVRDEIAWSQNLDKHLALLAQFATLQKKFDQIPTPGLRYSSAILARVPANTVVYASMPNLGEALNEANRIFQDQLQQSAVLREWWTKGQKRKKGGPTFDQLVDKVHALSQYLGDEVALVGVSGQPGGGSDVVVMAEVKRQGLREFLQEQFAELAAKKGSGLRVVNEQELASLPVGGKNEGLVGLVGNDFVLFSSSPRALRLMNAALNSGASSFTATDFGRRISEAYSSGAGFLLAVNLHELMIEDRKSAKRDASGDRGLQVSGFGDAQYLIAEHRDLSGTPDNRAVLQFAGQRRGIASWLGSPAPIGSLEFVSANAGMAVSFITKEPELMMDDILQMASNDKRGTKDIDEIQSKLGLNLRDDLAAAFGSDGTFALDGPVLPKPAWKVVAEVRDPSRLQNSIQRIVDAANQEAAKHGHPGMQYEQQEVSGRMYYVIRSLDPKALNSEVDYTFADGYLIAAPSRALVMAALETKANGDSLARSTEFRDLLPRDEHANYSGLFYQNLGPLVQPVASQLNAQQLQALQQIAAEAKPTVVCAYGDANTINLASSSRLLPFDVNSMAVMTLLGASNPGTSQHHRP
jgi:ferric-dicitrate binding protein FerR (iron transport regulator)